MSLADIASVTAFVISTINLWKITRKKQFKKIDTQLTIVREYLDGKLKGISDKLESIDDNLDMIGENLFPLDSMKDTIDDMRISLIEIKERIHFQSFLKEAAMVRPMPQLQIPVETNKKSDAMKKAWETRKANMKKEIQ